MLNLAAKNLIIERQGNLRKKTEELKVKLGRTPHLSVILVGSDPASQVYVFKKGEAADKVGFTHETILFEENATPAEVLAKVKSLNLDGKIDGILMQRPLPRQFKEEEVVYWVDPKKDVDCLHPENVGLLVGGKPRFAPCTPGGIMEMLEFYKIPVAGKIACVIGRSSIVGKPLAALLLSKNATVIQIHRGTVDPQSLCRQADLVFAAAGSKKLVTGDWIKQGAVVIDVGIHRGDDGKLVGDVDAASVALKASALSPVPGGVGPLTIQILLENTWLAASLKNS
jgi:methylenetetrahydrofolate dehydrogenase (NADP+)/methenyltetrahydrofolate cyclohydrolase